MTRKQRIAHQSPGLAEFWEPHLFYKCDLAHSKHLLRKLGLHYRVYFDPDDPPNSREWQQYLSELMLTLAGELYPAFKAPPSKGGRPKKGGRGLLHPLFDWPDADEARLVQLFQASESRLRRLHRSSLLADQAKEVLRTTSGKYPMWRYNDLRTAASLIRHGWRRVREEIKREPQRFLPPPGKDPIWFGKACLPPVPR